LLARIELLAMTHFFSPDPWLAETLSRPVFKLVTLQFANQEQALSEEMANLVKAGSAFFYAKLPTSEIGLCRALSRAGFAVIDTGITFEWTGPAEAAPADVSVGIARPAQYEAVAAIAERCFRWSRFHLDPSIPSELANRVKRRWIENYCRGQRGSALYVGEIGGAVAGFLAVIESRAGNRTTAMIDLVGVAPEHQGRRVGTALAQRFVDEWRGKSEALRVGTQAANIPSMRFYERNGFRAVESNYVLHAHFRNGGICT
jgi:dTDP-4-amino-4,6-dideoxy-D-galactose acyltransferase